MVTDDINQTVISFTDLISKLSCTDPIGIGSLFVGLSARYILLFSKMKSKQSHISSIKKYLDKVQALLVLIFALVILLAAWVIFKLPIGTTTATLVLDMGTEKRTFEGDASGNMTILDTLVASTAAGNVDLNYTFDQNGQIQIINLNDHSTYDPSTHFAFFLNSRPVNVSRINNLKVKPGDVVIVEALRNEAD